MLACWSRPLGFLLLVDCGPVWFAVFLAFPHLISGDSCLSLPRITLIPNRTSFGRTNSFLKSSFSLSALSLNMVVQDSHVLLSKQSNKTSLVIQACNPGTSEAEAATSQVLGHPWLHGETLSQKQRKKPIK